MGSTEQNSEEARDTMEISDVRQIEFKLSEKHKSIFELQNKAAMEEEYKQKMNQQKKLLSMEQEEMAKKQKLIALQLEMLQNELKQAELIKKLEDTRNIINKLQSTSSDYAEAKEKAPEETKSLTTCDYYHGPISWQDSVALLEDCEEGTFLVRDSQDPHFLYSLSFQRGKSLGPTSVRIQYAGGIWRLDSHQSIQDLMPSFPSIVDLVQYYVRLTRTTEDCPVRLRTGLSRRTV